jgi:transcriptional regulator with PAS, ATPase and Fis domain
MPGSFTGPHKSGRPSKFEIAPGETISLDEISEMPIDVQAKLLRVLQEREIIRVGGIDPLPVDVRVIAAMNQNVRELQSVVERVVNFSEGEPISYGPA